MSTITPEQGGFTDEGFTEEGFTHDLAVQLQTPVWLSDYYRPWRCKFEIWDREGFTLLASYDSFKTELAVPSDPFSGAGFSQTGFTHRANLGGNNFNLEYLDLEPSLGNISTGTFSCIIEDSNQILDRRKIGLGNMIRVFMGQTQGTYTKKFEGVIRFEQTDTSIPFTLRYFFSGFGSQYLLHERLVNFSKTANRSGISSTGPFVRNRSMFASTLVNTILTSTKALALNTNFSAKDTLKSLGNYDTGGIENINVFVPTLTGFYIPAANMISDLADSVGVEWGVSGNNRFYFRYPHSELSKDSIILKSIPDYRDGRDNPLYTSYITKDTSLQIGKTMRREDGFANTLTALAASKKRLDSASLGSTGSENLSGKALYQQVKAGSTRLQDIALTLSKSGSPPDVSGRILQDTGYDYPNDHQIIAEFRIDADDIETSAAPVFKLNLKFNKTINPGDHYWIVLYQISENTQEDDTVSWYHDNIADDATKELASGVQSPGPLNYDPDNPQGVTISKTGPTYSFGAFYGSQHIVVAIDPFSIKKYGKVDDIVSNTAIRDSQTTVQYLYSLLATTAKPKLIYSSFECTIPTAGFEPGQIVQIIDKKSGNTAEKQTLAEIISVRYVFDARSTSGSGDAVGIRTAELTLIGYETFLDEFDELGLAP